jgi:hypothetical protein
MGSPGPSRRPTSPDLRQRVPVVETNLEAVAIRLARLLSCLTWTTVRRVEPPADPPQPAVLCVDVPAKAHDSVHRRLTAAWRDASTLWNRPSDVGDPRHRTSERERRGAANGLWRMAMLLYGIGSHLGIISLRVGTRTEAELLAAAGECLGVLPSVDRVRGGFVVVVCSPGEVVRLLREAGAGDAAYAWGKGPTGQR